MSHSVRAEAGRVPTGHGMTVLARSQSLRDPLGDRVHEWVALQTVLEAQAMLGLLRRTPPAQQLSSVRREPPSRKVLAFGLGADSSAILARYLTEPGSRYFELHELAVITAMTGQEWPETRQLVEEHLLPRMAAAKVRYLQVARRGPLEADGVEILSDTRTPDRLHAVGAWTLAHEMFDGGTVPQTTGDRLCSQHFKAWPLDTVIAELTQGQPYQHIMGYELTEHARAVRDAKYNTVLRTGVYPLRTWMWDRACALAFLKKVFGIDWIKSACTYCPFALANQAGRVATVARFIAEPEAGVLALVMEFVATALNATQGLIKGQRLVTLLRNSPGAAEVLAAFEHLVAALPWAVYDVRRTLSPRADGKINHARSVRIFDIGDPAAMYARLDERARLAGVPVTVGDERFPDDTHPRAWLCRREPLLLADGKTTAEQFLTIAPATAINKTGPAFPNAWAAAAQFHMF